MTLTIAHAARRDIPTILRFIGELAAFEEEPQSARATPEDLERALFGQGASAEAVIARLDGVAAGVAVFFETFSTWTGRPGLHLEDLYVSPASRGLGVGSALMRHLARLALQRGCARFEWAVLDWNRPAIAFYRSKGAEPLDQWRTYRVDGAALIKLAEA